MKRILSLFLMLLLSCSFLVACQQEAPSSNGQKEEVNISQSERETVERAIELLVDEWEVLAVEDESNNGYLEIKNTRIIQPDSNDLANTLGVDNIEYIVEFIIFTDFYGAAPYYHETQHQNNVIFYSDGTGAVATNAVQMYSSLTYDYALKNCSFSVLDCKSTFNQVFDLEGKLNLETSTKPSIDDTLSTSEPAESKDDYKILDSGRCNENVAWEIRSNGTLYIHGNGTVPNYESRGVDGDIAPWRASAVHSEITDVIVSDGITGFGEQAFYGMNLSSIYFGHDVITYDYAVGGSMAVKTVYIPSAMKEISLFLVDSYHSGYQMTIYYEGTKAEWDAIVKDSQGKYSDYIINFNFEY